MRSIKKGTLLAVLLGIVLLFPGRAEARRGFVLFTYGEDVMEVGPVIEEHEEAVAEEVGGGAKVGYIHNAFGAFWLDIWTWDGRYCLYLNDQYWEIEPEQAATLLGQSVDDLGKPVFYTFPPGLLVLIAIAAIVIPLKIVSTRNENRVRKLFDDSRYQQALKMLSDRANAAAESGEASEGDNGFEESVIYLRQEGIEAEEARANLTLMVDTIIAQQQQAAQD